VLPQNSIWMRIAVAVLLPLVLLSFYGLWEARRVTITRVVISDPLFSEKWDGLKLVHLSDIHLERMASHEKAVLQAVEALGPDLICVTGDIAQWNAKGARVMEFLDALDRIAPLFASLGDADLSLGRARCFWCHDRGDIHKLKGLGPVILRDEGKLAKIKGRPVWIFGIDPGDSREEIRDFFASSRLLERSRKEPVIVLGHFSRPWKDLPHECHVLWLAGDTHGGQIWLPRPLWRLFRGKDHAHLYGLFGSSGGKWLFVTRGIGTTEGLPLRIGRPPEVAVITFAKPNKN